MKLKRRNKWLIDTPRGSHSSNMKNIKQNREIAFDTNWKDDFLNQMLKIWITGIIVGE